MDWRNISNGRKIPKEEYCDQPYLVITDDDCWLCVMTTGKGDEGGRNQHIISTRSNDKGKTWSEPVDIEPSGPPEASWVTPLKVPGGRVYVFYTYNGDNLEEVIGETEYARKRVDTLGYFVFKYSDDNGESWSKERFVIPIRTMQIDRENPYGGKIQFFWSVCKPIVENECVYIGLSKVKSFGEGFMMQSEGVILKSGNLLSESDPEKISWETLPKGDAGLRAPMGPIGEEHNLVSLSDGSLYCVYRTVEGHICHAYSRDDGCTWTEPQHVCYEPGGQLLKHPRAASFVRKYSNGKYTLWFHNHGGKDYDDRNPCWLCGGLEKEGYIYWSQPEIVLYDDDPQIRMSYPDFIQDGDAFYISETQKEVARIHKIENDLLEGMWGQFEDGTIAEKGLIVNLPQTGEEMPLSADMPVLDNFLGKANSTPACQTKNLATGFSLDVWIKLDEIKAGKVLLDTRTTTGIGFCLKVSSDKTLEIVLSDGRTKNGWHCDPDKLEEGKLHHVVVIVDGGPKIILFLIDGKLNDGGDFRQFGWGRFSPNLLHINGNEKICIGQDVKSLKIYNRAIRVSEAVGNFKTGV